MGTAAVAVIVALIFACPGFAKASSSDGAKLFQNEHCVMCHGMNGKGYAAIHTPDFTSSKWQAAHTDAQITEIITKGEKDANGATMPPFGTKLTASQIQDLMRYIRSLDSAKK
jgi:mono/diheme cytochrome c family protein